MVDNISNGSFENDSSEEMSPKTGLSTSFTISFEDEDDRSALKQKKMIKTTNMFIRRHVRTLSLPLGNDCLPNKGDPKCSGDILEKRNNVSSCNQKITACPATKEIEKGATTEEHVEKSIRLESTESDDCSKKNGSVNDIISDSDSEGGTYTLDKDNKEVQIARKTIDQVFGIAPSSNTSQEASIHENVQSKTRMIDEWIESSATAVRVSRDASKAQSVTMNCCVKKSYVSKIPSPVFIRRELNLKDAASVDRKQSVGITKSKPIGAVESKAIEKSMNSPTNGDIDTRSYLKETENIVAALQNRLHSDVKQLDVPEREASASKYSNTKLNRAFSLRRDRLNKPSPAINNTAIPIRAKNLQEKPTSVACMVESNGYAHSSKAKTSKTKELNRLKNGISSTSVTKSREHSRAEELKKKTYQRLKPAAGGGRRSNSSLSAQEIEFQNWKRRKSYDPLKAAAEDRKKKSMMQSAASSASVSTAALTKKPKPADQNVNEDTTEIGIMRSASFHGLRNKNGYDQSAFSRDDSINRSASSRFISSRRSTANSNSSDIVDNDDEDDWTIPKPPSTSLQNTPPESVSSRLSLLSHAMSSSSVLLVSSPNSKVNFTTLLNVSQLTREILSAVSTMTDPLRCDNESFKKDSELHFRNQNGGSSHAFDYRGECEGQEEENTFCTDSNFDEEDDDDTGNDESKSNELSGNYLLDVTLDNLKQIKDAVQKLQLVCPNK